jgi:hypothetical protein
MTRITKNFGIPIVAASVLCGARAARADVVVDWNAHMQNAVAAAPTNPNAQTRWGAIVQLAVFEAVNSITGRYVPYLGTITAPPGASPEAAAIAAAHRTLVTLRGSLPAVVADLDAKRANSLAAIPDGQAKTDGIAVGEAAAAVMLALRANDGSNNTPSYPGGSDPGEGRPELPAFAPALLPGWGNVTPFGMESGSQFRLPAPPHLQSEKYATALNEVKLLGRIDSPFRPQDRTDVARFYAAASPVQVFNSAARQISQAQGRSLSQNARDFALVGMAMADAAIAIWDTKYTYGFWRPITAIRLADTDGNELTEADPTWLPLIPTPAHPSYASGHASVSGAAKAVLEDIYGKDGFAFTLTTPSLPSVALNYTTWDQVTDDVDDARIYGGIHFRFDQEKGAHLGKLVGKYVLRNHLRAAKN